MAQFVEVPISRLAEDTLQALLEEFASREGTEYGLREFSLEEKVSQLRRRLDTGTAAIVYDQASEEWDILDAEALKELEL